MPDQSLPKFYLFINGILTMPEAKSDWNARAVTWAESRYDQLADRYEYLSDAIFRRIFQADRVKNCADILDAYVPEHELIVVGHSNGADIAVRLIETTNLKFAEVHLLAAAAEADFEKNGLNAALLSGRIGRLFLYGSHNDEALELALWSEKLAFLGIGYGALGRTGPKNLDPVAARYVTQVWCDAFGHGSWFTPANFADTMAAIVDPAHPVAFPAIPVPAPVRAAFLPNDSSKRSNL